MLPINFGFDPAASLNASGPALKSGDTPTATKPGLFHNMLRDAAAARAEVPAKTAPAHRAEAAKEAEHESAVEDHHAQPTDRQDLTAGADTVAAARAEVPAKTAPTHRAEAAKEDHRESAVEDHHPQPADRQDLTAGADTNAVAAEAPAKSAPARGEDAVNGAKVQPVWALLAQIIQNLTAGVDTNATAVEGQGDAVASGPAEGDAAEDFSALVDLLKQLQESPGVLTAGSAIPLDRLRQILEQLQAGANESQSAGLPGQLADLLKNVQEALPGIVWGRWAAALANPDGAAETVPIETATPAGVGPISATVSLHDSLPAGAGRAARGVLIDAKETLAAAGKADAAVRADEISDRGRPAADERSSGAGRVMPALPPVACPPAETLRGTAVASKAQASEGSLVLAKNPEAASDTQSEVSDDSRSPAEKATGSLTLSTADGLVEESDSSSLRFDAALRDVRSLGVTDGSPDKPAEAAAVAKSRDAASTAVKAGVFEQIVQRAAVQVKNDQGEIRIDLKPEFLGHVRLQIVTENQQVTVRIHTELPMVRDMIESNIQQLKSDLQQQGLRVERVEVAVADDPRQHPGRQAQTGAGRKGHAAGDVAPAVDEISTGLRPETSYRWGLGGKTTINMFA
jgi:hypothetical protein